MLQLFSSLHFISCSFPEIGAESDPCSVTYAGNVPFSEVETRVIRDFALDNKDRIKLYLTFHSYGDVSIYLKDELLSNIFIILKFIIRDCLCY